MSHPCGIVREVIRCQVEGAPLIVKCKDRFTASAEGGWADLLLISFVFLSDQRLHTIEVRLCPIIGELCAR